MTVPFDQIGPGQVGRYAYQVIGKDGPIFNPSNITYLRPEDAPGAPYFHPHGALAGLAGLNLVASIGAAAVSTAVLQEVRQMQRRLKTMDAKLDDIGLTLSDVQERVKHIDTRVSESHLREALRHCCMSSVSDGTIDLHRLTPLIDDIQNVEDTLDGTFAFNFGIRLSSDLREHLHSLLALLFGIRHNIICLHNHNFALTPDLWINHKELGDYFLPGTFRDIVHFAITLGRTGAVFNKSSEVLGEAILRDFTFAGNQDVEKFQKLALEHYYKPQLSALTQIPIVSSMGFDLSFVLDEFDLDYSHEDAFSTASDVFRLWVHETDASLLFRLKKELEAIRDGYALTFFSDNADDPTITFESPVFVLSDNAAAA